MVPWIYVATKWRIIMKKTALLLTTCCALVLAGCSATEPSTGTPQTTTQSTDSQASQDDSASAAATAAPEESTAAPEETTVALGDKMTLADWTITAKKASVEKKIKNGNISIFNRKKEILSSSYRSPSAMRENKPKISFPGSDMKIR